MYKRFQAKSYKQKQEQELTITLFENCAFTKTAILHYPFNEIEHMTSVLAHPGNTSQVAEIRHN